MNDEQSASLLLLFKQILLAMYLMSHHLSRLPRSRSIPPSICVQDTSIECRPTLDQRKLIKYIICLHEIQKSSFVAPNKPLTFWQNTISTPIPKRQRCRGRRRCVPCNVLQRTVIYCKSVYTLPYSQDVIQYRATSRSRLAAYF